MSAASGSNDSARLSFDWFEHAAIRGGTTLWTEDWCVHSPRAISFTVAVGVLRYTYACRRFSDSIAYHWSFFMSKLRSAAQDSPFAKDINFAAYTVPRTSGSYEGGMLQRMIAQIGSGAMHRL